MDHAMLPKEWERCFGSIWKEMKILLDRSGSATAVLLDASGNPVTYAGEDPDFDLSAFASLAVADFLATREMALLLGEDGLEWVVHQGARTGLVLLPLHPLVILGVLFDERTTLGLVRHQIRKQREKLVATTRPLLKILEHQIDADRREAEAEADGAEGDEARARQEDDDLAESLRRLFVPSS